MRIRGRWASPPDLQSSTSLQPVPVPVPPLHLPRTTHDHPSSILAQKTSITFQQDALTGVGKDKDEAQERSTMSATHHRNVAPNPSAETSADSSISSSLSRHGHWLEEDKVFPVKKRRVFMNIQSEPSNTNTAIRRARRKRMNKSLADHYIIKDDDFEWVAEMENPAYGRRASRRKKVSERCSRMNGRGWRCSRPSQAGYSMCEHHLTMTGRWKKKNYVLQKTAAAASKANDKPRKKCTLFDTGLYSSDSEDNDAAVADDQEGRIGAVKARALSSNYFLEGGDL